MEFEYDIRKSDANQIKHGISFEDAKLAWEVPGVEFPVRREGESRVLRVACVNGIFYSCVFTWREKRIRIISVRRSRPDEKHLYEQEMKRNEEKGKEPH